MSTESDRLSRPDPMPWLDVRLRVWIDSSQAWRAQVIGPGEAVLDFASPFELARFVASARAAGQRLPRDRLR